MGLLFGPLGASKIVLQSRREYAFHKNRVLHADSALGGVPGAITIEGHTDAFPSLIPNRSNWDISSERANAARRVLSNAGISPERVRAVTGLADTQPLKPGEPHLSVNRRISILLDLDG